MSTSPEDSRWQVYPPQQPGALPGPELPVVPEPVGLPTAPAVPGYPAVPAVPASPAGMPAIPPRPGYSPQDPLQLSAGGSTIRKEGLWTVPPYLSLHGDFGSIRLDFRRAQLTSQVVWIQVSGGAGTIIIVVPEGWGAQLDRVTPGLGTRKSTVSEEPLPGQPLLVFSGSLGMGTFKVRHPNRYDEGRLRRLLRREQRRVR